MTATRIACPDCNVEHAARIDGKPRKHDCVPPDPDTFALPWSVPPITQNQLRRMHYQTEARLKAQAKSEARWAIRGAHLEPRFAANVILHWRQSDNRRRDGDGAAPTLKVVLDALVAEGVLPDDSWEHVPHSGITCHPPRRGMPGALWVELLEPAQEDM